MSQDESSILIDEQDLKRAVQSAWGGDAASPALRQRIEMAMTRAVLEDPAIPDKIRRRWLWDGWPAPLRMAMGIAAMLLIALGVTWGIVAYQNTPHLAILPPRGPNLSIPAARPTLYALLVSRHDDFGAGIEPNTPADLAKIRDALAVHLNHPIWVPDLIKGGWILRGLHVYPIKGADAVVFNFIRGEDSISVFSLPVVPANPDDCESTIPDTDQLVNGRSLSSFSEEGHLYALIGSRGSAPYPPSDLHTLLTQFRSDPACRSAGCR